MYSYNVICMETSDFGGKKSKRESPPECGVNRLYENV